MMNQLKKVYDIDTTGLDKKKGCDNKITEIQLKYLAFLAQLLLLILMVLRMRQPKLVI